MPALYAKYALLRHRYYNKKSGYLSRQQNGSSMLPGECCRWVSLRHQVTKSAECKAKRGSPRRPKPLFERVLESWFAPKRFESMTLYELLGVLFVKRYVPTGGDFVSRRYGIRIFNIRGNLDSMIPYGPKT
jgi:hypothetical protein